VASPIPRRPILFTTKTWRAVSRKPTKPPMNTHEHGFVFVGDFILCSLRRRKILSSWGNDFYVARRPQRPLHEQKQKEKADAPSKDAIDHQL